MTNRVVVTGLGIICPIAHDILSFKTALQNGSSGVKKLTSIDTSILRVHIGAEVTLPTPHDNYIDRVTGLAIHAVKEAVITSGIGSNSQNFGVAWGTAGGGSLSFEEYLRTKKYEPGLKLKIPLSATAQIITERFKAGGKQMTISTACSSSGNAIAYAFEQIRLGNAEMIITGGSDTINLTTYLGFHALRLLDPVCCRPFDRERNGLVVGEGAGAIILENLDHAKARGANIIAEVGGYGNASDAFHETKPDPEGNGAVLAMERALADARLSPADIDYVNAHGTGTAQNDRMETIAIKKLLGKRAYSIPVSSTKSMIGHLIGAAGAVEAIATILAIKNSFIPPTINYQNPDPDCDLDYVPNQARAAKIGAALSNSFAFGGNNVSLVLKRHE